MADQSNEMVSRVARAICRANVLSMMKLAGLDYHDLTVEAEVDRLFKDDLPGARAAIEAMRRPVGEIHVPSDVEQYGANHNIPNFAAATYRSGYIDGHRAALSHDEVKG